MSCRIVIIPVTALLIAFVVEQGLAQQPPADKVANALLKAFVDDCIRIAPGSSAVFPGGKVELGVKNPDNELPSVTVEFDKPFRISKYEVTQELWELVMGSNPSRWKGSKNSVEMMNFQEAGQFCERLTTRLRESKLISETDVVRLPTEAEWEYCCRAGTSTRYSFGDTATSDTDREKKASLLDQYGWHTGNAAGNDPPVGALKPNPWGLYDMHGYLWEFVTPDERLKNVTKPDSESSESVIVRSGSWKDKYPRLTSSARKQISKDIADDAIGLRCVIATP